MENNAILQIVMRVRDEATSGMQSLGNSISDLGGNASFAFGKFDALSGSLAALGSGAIIGAAIGAFSQAELQTAKFNAIIKTLPPSLQAAKDAILSTADDALMKYGVDNEEAALSMARFLQATQSTTLTQQSFQAALDLSAMKGISLGDATNALIMAYQGGGRLLKQFGVEVDDHASKETILQAVMKVTTGQMEERSHTLQASIDRSKSILGEFAEALGAKFKPAIETANNWIVKVINTFGGLQKVIQMLQPILTFLAVFLSITLVVAAGAAVIAFLGIIGVSGVVVAWIAAIAAGITFLVTLFQTFGPSIIGAFRSAWETVKNISREAIDYIVGLFGSVTSRVSGIVDSVMNAYNMLKSKLTGATSAATGMASTVLQKIVSILPFAEGGIVTGPTMGLVGEAGPEAIIPLSRLGGMGMGGGISITLQGDFYSDTETAERFGNQLARVIKNQLNLGGIRA